MKYYTLCGKRKISKKTKEELEEGTTKAANAVIEILKNGLDKAMNQYN